MSAQPINPQMAYEMIKAHEAILIDVREADEYAQAHIANAYSMPLSQLPEIITQLIIAKDTNIIIHCRMGPRGDKAALILQEAGFEEARLYNMTGGITSWAQDALPVIEAL